MSLTRTAGLSCCLVALIPFFHQTGASIAAEKPVQVFVLAGQSNMQGQGVVDLDHEKNYNGGKGNLEHVMQNPDTADRYKHLKDTKGNWVVRDDVWVWHKTERSGLKKGGLGIGYTSYSGKHHIGPELQIGHRLGDQIDSQVLLIKTAWGGKSLHKDFRPPSSGGEAGPYYTRMLNEVQQSLNNLPKHFPGYNNRGYEVAGFVWFQGWNDMYNEQARREYEQNLVNLIRDVRIALKRPELPVVIGELGNGGEKAAENMLAIRRAQAAVAARPNLKETVRFGI